MRLKMCYTSIRALAPIGTRIKSPIYRVRIRNYSFKLTTIVCLNTQRSNNSRQQNKDRKFQIRGRTLRNFQNIYGGFEEAFYLRRLFQ